MRHQQGRRRALLPLKSGERLRPLEDGPAQKQHPTHQQDEHEVGRHSNRQGRQELLHFGRQQYAQDERRQTHPYHLLGSGEDEPREGT